MEKWTTIVNLKQNNARLGERKIAELAKVSRGTVRKVLREEKQEPYSREEQINPELAPYEEFIHKSLIQKKLRGSRVLEDLRSKGCTVSRSAAYRYFKKVRVKEIQAYKRYETKPGEQSQFDWSPYTVKIGNTRTVVQVYSFLLGFSRYRIYFPSLRQNQVAVLEAMEYGIRKIGGVTERVQTDNHSTLVDDASVPVYNKVYLHFARHYGFNPSRSRPGHPESKGKVENPFSFLEGHFIQGNEFSSFEDFSDRLKEFNDKVNSRKHDTTGVPPKDLFDIEKGYLNTIPEQIFVHFKEEFRKVGSDCLISYKGNRYSVPHVLAGRNVWVRESKGYDLLVYSQKNALVASHTLVKDRKGCMIMVKEHFVGYRKEMENWTTLSKKFLEKYPEHEDFLEKLKAQKRINPSHHLIKIVEGMKYFQKEDIDKTIEECHRYNIYRGDFFVKILHGSVHVSTTPTTRILIPEQPRTITRSLDHYARENITDTETSEEC